MCEMFRCLGIKDLLKKVLDGLQSQNGNWEMHATVLQQSKQQSWESEEVTTREQLLYESKLQLTLLNDGVRF